MSHVSRVPLQLIIIVALCVAPCVTRGASEGSGESPLRHIPVYLQAPAAGTEPDIELKAPGLHLETVSTHRISSSRPLLVIVDPASYPTALLRRRLSLLGKALSETAAFSDAGFEVRVGIPVLAGILSEPFRNPAAIAQYLQGVVDKYAPDDPERAGGSLGRTLDLIGTLIQKAEKTGPVDCLILAADRRFEEAQSVYLHIGMERRFLELCGHSGTTLYGLLDGNGELGELCTATGGLAFPGAANPLEVLRQILDGRAGGYLLEVRYAQETSPGGCFILSAKVGGAEGRRIVRAPRAIWIHPDAAPAADYFHMRDGLDWMRRAEEAYQDENYTVALSFAENAGHEDPWNPQSALLAAKSAAAAGDLALAATHLSVAVRFDSAPSQAFVLYGAVMQKLGRTAEALGRFDSFPESVRNGKAEIRLQYARLLSASGRLIEAEQAYTTILNTDLDDDRVRAEYGTALLESGDLQAGREQLRASLDRNSNNSLALTGLSRIELSQGHLDESLKLALQASRSDSRNPDAEAQLGRIYAARQDWGPAVEHLKAATLLDPARLDLTLALADTCLRAGRASDADDLVRAALGSYPRSADLHRKLAEACIRSGDLAGAAVALETGAARTGTEAAGLFRAAAELRERRGEYGQALLDYRAALESSPPEAASELGSKLRQHLIYLALSVDNAQELSGLPIGRQLGLDKTTATITLKRTPAKPSGQEAGAVPVPGGIAVLSKALAMDEAELRGPDALARIAGTVLRAGSPKVNSTQNNSLQHRAVAALQVYADLLRYMGKKHLLPDDFDPHQEQKVIFPLAGSKETVARTARFLGFFGVKYKYRESKDGKPEVELTLKSENEKVRDRRQLLRHLGVELQDRNLRDITITLREDRLPMPFTAEALSSRFLPGKKPVTGVQLEKFLLSPRAMRLYQALSYCSEAAREGLLSQTAPGELLSQADTLAAFGRYLDFREGKLILPGGPESWEALLQTSEPEQLTSRLFSLDGGRPIALYAGLAVASPPVQEYFTATPERLRQLYQSLAPYTGVQLANAGTGLGGQGLGRVLRLLSVRHGTLTLDLGNAVTRRLLRDQGGEQDAQAQRAGTPDPVRATDIPELAGPTRAGALGSHSRLEIVELMHFLQDQHSDAWTGQSLASIMDNPTRVPVLVDLVGDLKLPAETLNRYLNYCTTLIQAGDDGWNINRIRTSQSLFYLLSILSRAGSLNNEKAVILLDHALSHMEPSDEAQFAESVADFLSEELLPALQANGNSGPDIPGPLMRALAGTDRKQEFSFEGRRLEYDASARRLERMQGAVVQQRYNPLPRLLEVYHRLGEIASGNNVAPDLVAALAQQLKTVETAQFAAGEPKTLRQFVAHVDLEALHNSLETAAGHTPAGSKLQQACKEIAIGLHTELGVTLLTYCYAYHGSPEVDALAFDPNFVRKHTFADAQSAGLAWAEAHLENRPDRGTYLAGSVSGIDSELGRLELAQSARDFAGNDEALLPTLLLGMRSVPGEERTDRAQEYVALSLRLGREIVTLAALDGKLEAWCNSYLSTIVPPRRFERFEQSLGRLVPSAAMEALSPSELFFLAQHYLDASNNSGSSLRAESDVGAPPTEHRVAGSGGTDTPGLPFGKAPPISSPSLDKLRLLQKQAQDSDASAFRRELEQYGPEVRHRMGLRQSTLQEPEPYEYLELSTDRQLLYERICDLKIRLAELHYSLGLPAPVVEADGEFALREILIGPAGKTSTGWQRALEKTARLRPDSVRVWIEESLNHGLLTVAEQETASARNGVP
jgi:thioredoxin-like negative regulator of GroEL